MNFVWASPSGIIDNPAVHRSRELSSRHNHVIFFNRVPSSRLIRAALERDAMTRRSPFQRVHREKVGEHRDIEHPSLEIPVSQQPARRYPDRTIAARYARLANHDVA